MKRVLVLSAFVRLLTLCGLSAKAAGYPNLKSIGLVKADKNSGLNQMESKIVKINLKDLSDFQIKKLEAFFLEMNVSLSCVSITYTGETAEARYAIIMAGYYSQLVAMLEWYWCGGGYEIDNPPTPEYLYA